MKLITMLVLVLLFSCSEQPRLKSEEILIQKSKSSESNFFNFISTVKLPEKLEFCGEKVPLDIPEVRERAEREFYMTLQQPGQLMLYIKRAGRYFPLFEKILKLQNMPDDLKYLSVAESALYMARSAKNAVGLWQFIPSTGEKMGLRINELVDERRHPEKSTVAALKYLKMGYDSNGSWFLAAAGYNMGHTNVANHLKYQEADDAFDLFMNEETSRYLLRIVIIKELMEHAEKYGIKLDSNDVYKPDTFKSIKVHSIQDVAEWSKEQGTSYKMVKLLNPWILNRKLPALPKGEYYEVYVP